MRPTVAEQRCPRLSMLTWVPRGARQPADPPGFSRSGGSGGLCRVGDRGRSGVHGGPTSGRFTGGWPWRGSPRRAGWPGGGARRAGRRLRLGAAAPARYMLRFANLALLERVAPRRPRWGRHVSPALLAVALMLLIVALAGPVARVQVPRNRAVVLLVIDVSLSMNATDVVPTRLLAAPDAATRFAHALTPGVNLGLESFSGTAEVLVAPQPVWCATCTAVSSGAPQVRTCRPVSGGCSWPRARVGTSASFRCRAGSSLRWATTSSSNAGPPPKPTACSWCCGARPGVGR